MDDLEWPMIDFNKFPNNEISGLSLSQINAVMQQADENLVDNTVTQADENFLDNTVTHHDEIFSFLAELETDQSNFQQQALS